jgi:hypothetical protein
MAVDIVVAREQGDEAASEAHQSAEAVLGNAEMDGC